MFVFLRKSRKEYKSIFLSVLNALKVNIPVFFFLETTHLFLSACSSCTSLIWFSYTCPSILPPYLPVSLSMGKKREEKKNQSIGLFQKSLALLLFRHANWRSKIIIFHFYDWSHLEKTEKLNSLILNWQNKWTPPPLKFWLSVFHSFKGPKIQNVNQLKETISVLFHINFHVFGLVQGCRIGVLSQPILHKDKTWFSQNWETIS